MKKGIFNIGSLAGKRCMSKYFPSMELVKNFKREKR
tara:strand:+ start:1526 stop:1633 length:108 start_codon:yes stop_codon:yes gene_type:complete